MRRLIHPLALPVIACVAFLASAVGDAAAGPMEERRTNAAGLPEYTVKAAFVYNFARFTEWPDAAFQDAGSPLHLCVLGQDPFDGALNTIAGKSVGSRELQVSYPIWASEVRDCHILFISQAAGSRLPEIVTYLDDSPVLTIGDSPDIARSGGIIGLENVENRIRFQVNLDAAHRSGLRLSSQILDLATSIHSERLSGPVN